MREHVLSNDLVGLLGYRSKASLNHLVGAGALAPPAMVLCTDGRWRRAWPRQQVETLLMDPPDWLSARATRARAALSAIPRS